MHITKANNPTLGAGFVFRRIGASNGAFSLLISVLSLTGIVKIPTALLGILSGLMNILFLLQLGFNVSLAFMRLKVVGNPLEYHTSEAKRNLEKKISIVVLTSSFILGFSCSLLRFLFQENLITYMLRSVSRVLACVLLCVFYVKLYFVMKSQSGNIAPATAEQGEPSCSNEEIAVKRKKQLAHSSKFFIGITTSFFVLNLPGMMSFYIMEELQASDSLRSNFFVLSLCLSLLNMVFDAFWYFYMERRSRRL